MKKRIIVCLMSVLFSPYAAAMMQKFVLPDNDTLTMMLKSIGMDHFIEKTGIISELASKNKNASEIVSIFDKCIAVHHAYVETTYRAEVRDAMCVTVAMQRTMALQLLLGHVPGALQELTNRHLYPAPGEEFQRIMSES